MERKTMTNQNQEPNMTLAAFLALEFTFTDIEGYIYDERSDINGSSSAISTCDTVFICFDWHAIEMGNFDFESAYDYDIRLGRSECDCDYAVSGVTLIDEDGDEGTYEVYAAIDKKLNDDRWKSMVRDTVLTDFIVFRESQSN